MRNYTTYDGTIVDLDDKRLYENYPDDITKLVKSIFEEIGYSYWYMNFKYKDVFENEVEQKKRVIEFISNFTSNYDENRRNSNWLKEQLFLIRDEIENMI